MFAAGKTAAISGGGPPDDKFNYVTMLLHGDGTNGAQNNTFLDSGPNTLSITRNGNTTQGSFSPYGSNWSNYFDGSGDYLSVPDNAALEGFTDFTFECWVYVSDFSSGDCIFAKGWTPGSSTPYMFYFSSTDLVFYATSSSTWDVASGEVIVSNIVKNQWYHVAASRSGSSIKLFANGVVTTSFTSGLTLGTNAGAFTIGASLSGDRDPIMYVSNLRINNTALYTAAFTPSTTPLTAVSGTALLTCQSNRFLDNSSNAFAVSVGGGTPSVQRFNPFGASTAYSTSVIGGSGYFDGAGDYLSGPTNNAAFQFGTGDFTVEAWAYHTADDSYPSILEIGDHLATTGILFIMFGPGGGNVAAIYSGGFKGSTAVTMNAWNHIAYVRSSGSLKIYVNGVSPAGVAFTNNLTNSNKVTIGVDQNISTGYFFAGNISDLRVVKGTAVYTSNFTPPTAPLTAISGTSLLMPMTNAGIFDNAMMTTLETVGIAQISTS